MPPQTIRIVDARRRTRIGVNALITHLAQVMAQMCVVMGYLVIAVAALLLGWLLSATPQSLDPDPHTMRLLRLLFGGASLVGAIAMTWKGHAMLVRFAHRRIVAYLKRGLR